MLRQLELLPARIVRDVCKEYKCTECTFGSGMAICDLEYPYSWTDEDCERRDNERRAYSKDV